MRIATFISLLSVFQTTALAQNASQWQALLQSARDTAIRSSVGEKTIAQRDGPDLFLLNKHVFVHIRRADGAWDAAWLGKTDAAIERAGFALEWNGTLVGLASSPIETKPFTNQFGSGIEATQKAGDEVQIVRTLRVYDDKSALTLSAKITNTSKQ